jgi:penicillin-binding protein 1A
MVTGIWIGFDQPRKIKANAQGGVLAGPAWSAMMREVYERRPVPLAWSRPAGLSALDVDKTTGYKATPFCPKDVHYIESFIPGTEPGAFCPVHSPFGSIGVLGGDAPQPDPDAGAPTTSPGGTAPAQPNPQGGTSTSGGGTGVMGGTGPAPNQPR